LSTAVDVSVFLASHDTEKIMYIKYIYLHVHH
jgi:hypothetical protein